MGIQNLWKILLIASLAGCSTAGSVKIYALDPNLGLVRENGDEVIPLSDAECKADAAHNRVCPFAVIGWDDLRTLIEEAK